MARRNAIAPKISRRDRLRAEDLLAESHGVLHRLHLLRGKLILLRLIHLLRGLLVLRQLV